MKRRVLISAIVLSAFAATPVMAAPQWVKQDRVERILPVDRMAQRQITPAEAKRIALSRVRGGEVVDIRRSGDAYRVRVIARDGRVVDIVVDAKTGRVR